MLFFQSPLVQAIFSRDAEEVTFLLNHNQDASSLVMLSHYRATTDQNSWIAFVAVFLWNLWKLAVFVPPQDQEQSTPLHAASYLGDVHIMELLLASGKETMS